METNTIVTESGRRKLARARAEQAVVAAEDALTAIVAQPVPDPRLPRTAQVAEWAVRRAATMRAEVRVAVAFEGLRDVADLGSALWLAAYRANTSIMWELSRGGHSSADVKRVRDEVRDEMADAGTRVTGCSQDPSLPNGQCVHDRRTRLGLES